MVKNFCVAALCLLTVGTGSVSAQLPRARLFAIFPPGGKQDTAVQVKLHGADLDDVRKLVFSHVGVTAEPEGDGFKVTISKDVPPGRYECRALGRFGVSNPRSFIVNTQPEAIEVEPNNQLDTAQEVQPGVVVNGRCQGNQDADFISVKLEENQRVLFECWAERIDSQLDGAMVVFGPDGREMAHCRNYVGRDPLIDFTAPKAGRYVVRIRDFLYRDGDEFVYRLRIGSAPRIDYVFPPVGQPGSLQSLTVFGRNLPGGVPALGTTLGDVVLDKLQVDLRFPSPTEAHEPRVGTRLADLRQAGVDSIDYSVTSAQGVSNSLPVGIATSPIAIEHEPNDAPNQANQVRLPVEFVGQFAKRGDRDWVEFDAVKDEAFWIEVFSQRHGLSSDPFLVLQKVEYDAGGHEKANDVKESDDAGPSNWSKSWSGSIDDPVFSFKAPGSGRYRLMIRDLYSDTRGGPHLVYRVAIRRPRPDFKLVAVAHRERAKDDSKYEPAAPLLRPGGTEAITVFAQRRDGFAGPIELTVHGLPDGIQCEKGLLGPGVDSCVLVLNASESMKSWCGPIQIQGSAQIAGLEVRRSARASSLQHSIANNRTPRKSRLTHDLMLAAIDHEKSACRVTFGEQSVVESPKAKKIKVPVKIVRGPGAVHPIKLQPHFLPPNVKGKEITIPGDKTEGEYELDIDKNAPVGEFSLAMNARTQFDYRRNQLAVDHANQALAGAKETVEQTKSDVDSAKQAESAADAAKTQAQEQIVAVTSRLAGLRIQEQAEKAHAEAMTALRDISQEATGKQPQNRALVTATKFATTQAEDALKRLKQATADLSEAQASLERAKETVLQTEQRLVAAHSALEIAMVNQKEAEEGLKVAEKNAKEISEKNKPEKRDVALTSNALLLRIKPIPAARG